jgi:hypothetical protein
MEAAMVSPAFLILIFSVYIFVLCLPVRTIW